MERAREVREAVKLTFCAAEFMLSQYTLVKKRHVWQADVPIYLWILTLFDNLQKQAELRYILFLYNRNMYLCVSREKIL